MEFSSPKAVFLSYAREDTVAVQRIADALRLHGVEVWFDQNELRGGDAWEAKIRRQINECALFMPVISASTNLRLEGYFRREWKQAVERTHGMDDDLPFLVPVVIDATPDAEKPACPRGSAWPSGRDCPAARLRRPLANGSGGCSRGILDGLDAGRPSSQQRVAPVPRRHSRWIAAALAVMAAAVAAVVVLRPWRSRPSPKPPPRRP